MDGCALSLSPPIPFCSIEVEDVREQLIALSFLITIKIGRSIKESNTDDLFEQFLLAHTEYREPLKRSSQVL